MESKIRGLKVELDIHKIKIYNANKIKRKEKMKEIILLCLKKNCLFENHREINSFIKEWKMKNRFFPFQKKYIFTNKNNKIKDIIYFILGSGGK